MQRRSVKHAAKALKDRAADEQRHTADVDVQAEAQRMEARCKSYVRLHSSGVAASTTGDDAGPVTSYAVEMYGLRKTFPRGGLVFSKQSPFIAVRGNWVGIHEGDHHTDKRCLHPCHTQRLKVHLVCHAGECFCLLGPNGAGKTTTINCLTGVVPLTAGKFGTHAFHACRRLFSIKLTNRTFHAGDALIYSESIVTAGGLDRARPLMGVCPQFDTGLWELLTGNEHLALFASIKGLPAQTRAVEVSKVLEDVKVRCARVVDIWFPATEVRVVWILSSQRCVRS